MADLVKKTVVIGGGFAGLAAAAYLAREGVQVTILEKNQQLGGRARTWTTDGFCFDMGPSWYWMPDLFEEFFAAFGKQVSDFYELKRLDPSYRVFFGANDFWDIPAGSNKVGELFEAVETGAAKALQRFLQEAERKYQAGMYDYARRPSLSYAEFFDARLILESLRMNLFGSFGHYVRKHFSHPRIRQILEFPVLFLGATAPKTPAMYSMMPYADIELGTWYPLGGMGKIVQAMEQLLRDLGVEIQTGAEVTTFSIDSAKRQIKSADLSNGRKVEGGAFVAGADYQHVESKLLPEAYRGYSEHFWEQQVFAPSCLLYYVGLDIKVPGLQHHNLLFDEDFEIHAREIYETKRWPTQPHSYVCVPSKTDASVAPTGCENLFILIPVATGLQDTVTAEELVQIQERYFERMLSKLEKIAGMPLSQHIKVKRAYSGADFVSDYHAYKGNAYGLANTLRQTAVFKPKMRSKRLKNLYFTGQLTVPGPGVPPSLLSGMMVAKLITGK